jgi:hypothetical protein
MPLATAAVVELEESRFELVEHGSEFSQHVKESRDDMEKSSQHL